MRKVDSKYYTHQPNSMLSNVEVSGLMVSKAI